MPKKVNSAAKKTVKKPFTVDLPKGEILEDITKKKWRLGAPLGQGGFGLIYSAQEESTSSAAHNYVIKIEPHTNGPLFVEMHFYMKFCKSSMIEAFMKDMHLKSIGVPVYRGSGSHEFNNQKYRFLVLDKYGSDIYELLQKHKSFPISTVFKLGSQIVDILNYIHSKGYVHADIKPANLLLGDKKLTKDQVYLLDFGLVAKFTTEKEFKPNPKKAHDGTLEYLSRDAHKGVPTRRGDLEILAYNLIEMLGYSLPWKYEQDPNKVSKQKESFMDDISQSLKTCFGNSSPPGALKWLLDYVNSISHITEPDYNEIKHNFENEIKKSGDSSSVLVLEPNSKRTSLKRKSSEKCAVVIKKNKVQLKSLLKPKKKVTMKSTTDDSEELTTNKKSKIVKKNVKNDEQEVSKSNAECSDDPFKGYTPEMRLIMEKKMKKAEKKKVGKIKPVEGEPNGRLNGDLEGFTEEMKEVTSKLINKKNGNSEATSHINLRPKRAGGVKTYYDETPEMIRKLYKRK